MRIAAAVLLLAGCAATAAPVPRDLGWMTGCWAFERDGTRYEEAWLPPATDGSLGMARALRDGRMLYYEFTRLERNADGSIDYVADPSGQKTTRFRLVSLEGRRAQFENPAHDFPTRIVYASPEPGRLDARIEGLQDGKPRIVEYPFRRAPCHGG